MLSTIFWIENSAKNTLISTTLVLVIQEMDWIIADMWVELKEQTSVKR